jgi:hypothetical protein
MDRSQFPWQPLGTLLVEEGLVSTADVEQALLEQRRTGRLLGEIVVQGGFVTGADLARALAKQHCVELQPSDDDATALRLRKPTPASPAEADPAWRPLGRVLVEKGFVTATALYDALRAQAAQPQRRLGEILVASGSISGRRLALALAEQHGVSLESEELDHDVETLLTAPPRSGEPRFEVWDVSYEPSYERRSVLFETNNFLEAADHACELVDRLRPDALEIQRRDNGTSETVWTYSKRRADALAAERGIPA